MTLFLTYSYPSETALWTYILQKKLIASYSFLFNIRLKLKLINYSFKAILFSWRKYLYLTLVRLAGNLFVGIFFIETYHLFLLKIWCSKGTLILRLTILSRLEVDWKVVSMYFMSFFLFLNWFFWLFDTYEFNIFLDTFFELAVGGNSPRRAPRNVISISLYVKKRIQTSVNDIITHFHLLAIVYVIIVFVFWLISARFIIFCIELRRRVNDAFAHPICKLQLWRRQSGQCCYK